MKTILYNSLTSKVVSRIYPNGYTVDGILQTVEPPLFELEYMPTDPPVHDPILHNISSTWQMVGSQWLQVWTIKDKVLPTLSEAKLIKIAELKSAVKDLYQTVQWNCEMYRAEGTAIPAAVVTKIKTIKTKYEQAKSIINGYTSVSDVLHWQIPYDQINTIKASLEAII